MPQSKYRYSKWKSINFGCAVASILIVFIATFYLGILMKMVGDKRFQAKLVQAQKLQQCKLNLRELSNALERYKEGTGDYPNKLSDLLPLYLKKPDFLHCPNDPSPVQKISYEYNKPSTYDPNFIVIICNNHPNPLALFMNGDIRVLYRKK